MEATVTSTRQWTWWGALAVVAVLVLFPSAAIAAPRADIPDGVVEWFRTEGVSVGEDHADWADAEELLLGPPRPVASWAPEFLDGLDAAAPVALGQEWIAVISRVDGDIHQPVGVLRALWATDAVAEVNATADGDLAEALDQLDPGLLAVYDPDLDGWFATGEAKVWPLTEGARELLVGAVPLSTLQTFMADGRTDLDDSHGITETPPESGNPTLVGMAVVVTVGAAAVTIVARQLRRSDERLANEMGNSATTSSG